MRLLTCLVLVAVFAACAQSQPLWEDCFKIAGFDVCADLTERSPCNFHVTLGTSLMTIFDKPIDLAVQNPTVCGTFASCLICLSLSNITRQNSQNVSMCVGASNACLATKQNLGCFTDATGSLARCVYSTCPNGCSGNGNCVGGVCQCNLGYQGADCSESQLGLDQCLSTPYGQLCLDMQFEQCGLTSSLSLAGIPVYKTDTPITAGNFGSYFATSRCLTAAPNCQACMGWNNFFLNSTYMTGCPRFNMSCLGSSAPYQFDCFTDTQLTPACFGDCPAGCSNRGTCSNGACICNVGYSGNMCESAKCDDVNECSGQGTCTAPNTCSCINGYSGKDCSVANCDGISGCSGHGKCTAPNVCTCDAGYIGKSCETPTCTSVCVNNGQCIKGKCVCTNGWTGNDCSTKSDPSSGSGNGVYIGVGIAVGLGLAAVGGGGFIYWRRRRAASRYGTSAFDDGLLQVPTTDDGEQ